jgi:UDP-N-acetylglucosamine 2-epimerase
VLMDKIMLMVGTRPVIIKIVPVLRLLQAKSTHARADCPISERFL